MASANRQMLAASFFSRNFWQDNLVKYDQAGVFNIGSTLMHVITSV